MAKNIKKLIIKLPILQSGSGLPVHKPSNISAKTFAGKEPPMPKPHPISAQFSLSRILSLLTFSVGFCCSGAALGGSFWVNSMIPL